MTNQTLIKILSKLPKKYRVVLQGNFGYLNVKEVKIIEVDQDEYTIGGEKVVYIFNDRKS